MLTTLKRDLEREAQLAPEYNRDERTTDMIETFANKYCEAVDSGDQRNSSVYMSCLLLKFWNRITDIYAGKDKHYGDQISFLVSNGQITIEDVFYKVYECINTAMKYRTWKKPDKHTTAQACINQIISSRAAGELLRPFNLKKNEGMIFTRSLDEYIDDEDGKITLEDVVADTSSSPYEDSQSVRDLVQLAIDDNKIVEAIIFDNIAFSDCHRLEKKKMTRINHETGEEEEYSRQVSSFWAHALVKELGGLGDKYRNYFLDTYDINNEKLDSALGALKKANNQKRYRMIESAKNYGREVIAM